MTRMTRDDLLAAKAELESDLAAMQEGYAARGREISQLTQKLDDALAERSAAVAHSTRRRAASRKASDVLRSMHNQFTDLTPIDAGIYIGRALGILGED